MRQAVRVTVLLFLSLLSTAVLAAITAVFSAISLAATALIVPGTGTPDANVVAEYREHFVDRYSAPFNPACTSTNGCTLDGIDYPASFFPLVIFDGWCEPGRCDTWNTSVGKGVDGLYDAVEGSADPNLFVLGYSQGGAVVSNTLRRIQNENPDLLDKIDSVVLIGNAYNPDGGLFTRLGFLPTIPILDVTFGPATPVDTGVDMIGIGFEYDPVMYAPRYWGNPLAMLNALAAFDNVHGYYLTPNGNGPTDSIAYGYTEAEIAAILATGCPGAHCRINEETGNRYYMIPAKSLPLMNLISSVIPEPLRPFAQPIIELVAPTAKVLIDLAYNWNGDPDQTRYASILPFSLTTNWVQVGFDLVEAAVEGVENAFGGGSMMVVPADELESTVAAAQQRSLAVEEEEPAEAKRTALTVVPDAAPSRDAVVETSAPVTDEGDEDTTGDGTGDDGTGDEGAEDEGVDDEEVTGDDDATTDPTGTKDDETDVDTDDGDTVTTGTTGTDAGDAGDGDAGDAGDAAA